MQTLATFVNPKPKATPKLSNRLQHLYQLFSSRLDFTHLHTLAALVQSGTLGGGVDGKVTATRVARFGGYRHRHGVYLGSRDYLTCFKLDDPGKKYRF